jgi:hypothetical protein
MDDVITAAQVPSWQMLQHFTQAILHAINDVFPPPNLASGTNNPISTKKCQEEGPWSATKEILGWEFDGYCRTSSITATKADQL